MLVLVVYINGPCTLDGLIFSSLNPVMEINVISDEEANNFLQQCLQRIFFFMEVKYTEANVLLVSFKLLQCT